MQQATVTQAYCCTDMGEYQHKKANNFRLVDAETISNERGIANSTCYGSTTTWSIDFGANVSAGEDRPAVMVTQSSHG